MEMLSKPSVDALQRKIVGITARPKGEFNKYDALELLESLKDTAHDLKHEKSTYYREAYDTMQDKIGEPPEYFRELMLALLGDKDLERVWRASVRWNSDIHARLYTILAHQ